MHMMHISCQGLVTFRGQCTVNGRDDDEVTEVSNT